MTFREVLMKLLSKYLTEDEMKRLETNEMTSEEFQKIMMTPQPSVGLLLLEQSGLMQHILPELVALKGIEEVEGQKHKDNFYHTLEVVDNISMHTENVWLRWSALLHDIGKALDHDIEGTHVQIGVDILKKYKEQATRHFIYNVRNAF